MIGMKLLSGWFETGSFRPFVTLCNFYPALLWKYPLFFVMLSPEVTGLVLVDTCFGLEMIGLVP